MCHFASKRRLVNEANTRLPLGREGEEAVLVSDSRPVQEEPFCRELCEQSGSGKRVSDLEESKKALRDPPI